MKNTHQNPTPHTDKERLIIYQTFPRILTNMNEECRPWGSLKENGSGNLADYDATLLRSLKNLGINTIWLTGVIEHATKTDFSAYGISPDNPNVVKGEAGSPYAIKDYYDVNPALAVNPANRMKEFEDCVERIHKAGMKMLIDFVPNHTARRYHSDSAPIGVKDFGADDNTSYFFSPSNNYYYIPNQQFAPSIPLDKEGAPYIEFPAKATGNDCFTAFCGEYDWYETVKLNYGHDYGDNSDHFTPIPETWIKMLNILNFWASKGVDGFRCDMVFMVPLAFWHWVIPEVKKHYPDTIFIGEIYDVGLYRPFLDYGCFDYLYDKVNLYDTLVGIERHGFSAARLTGCWQSLEGIAPKMLNFLENHDEVRYSTPEFGGDPSRVVPDLVVSALMSNGPYMIYYGQELGIKADENEGFAGYNNRTTIFDYWSYEPLRRWYDNGRCSVRRLNAHEKWLRSLYGKVLKACNSIAAFRSGSFFDLMYVNLQNPQFDPHRQYAFIRYDDKEAYLIVANFADAPVEIALNIPELAIKMCGLEIGEVGSHDLLWNKEHKFDVAFDKPARLNIGARDALILPLNKINNKQKYSF